jgi:Cu/Ag efflux pump CusA
LISATLLTLVVLPSLYLRFARPLTLTKSVEETIS